MKNPQKGPPAKCPAGNNCVGGQGMEVDPSFLSETDEGELSDQISVWTHVVTSRDSELKLQEKVGKSLLDPAPLL